VCIRRIPVEATDQRLKGTLLQKRDEILAEWLSLTLRSYPEQASRLFLVEKDPFRNPIGHALKEGLAVLVDELFGPMDRERLVSALESIVRIRAVQDFSAAQAVAFIFLLKKVIREKAANCGEGVSSLEERVDELALLAFDLYMKCREKLAEVRVNAAMRSLYVPLNRRNRKAAG
jgi:hypothetical protein